MAEASSLNIRQIAELAGVSVATVSRVINQNGRFSAETEARVRQVIADSGYVPDVVAKSLRTSRAQVIGVVVPDILNPHFAGLVLELEKILFAQAYSTMICNTNESTELEQKHIDTLIAQKVSGIIIISGSIASVKTRDIPYIYLDRRPTGYAEQSGLLLVESDNQAGGYLAARKLIDSGCRNIAVVSSRIMDYNQTSRFTGFKQALLEAGQTISADKILVLDEVSASCARARITREFALVRSGSPDFALKLNQSPGQQQPIDGLMCMTDTIALGVITALQELQIRIPEDVSVTGFDDSPLSGFFQPPLTTIRQDVQEMAHSAAHLILSMIRGQPVDEPHRVIPVSLVTRRSTR